MGRHAAPRTGGRVRGVAMVVVPTVVALLAAGGGWVWWSGRPDATPAVGTRCAEPLEVLVATELGPVVRDLLTGPDADGCRLARVASASSLTAVQQIASGSAPEVWVPDSSSWADALPGSGTVPGSPDGWTPAGSVATTPVLLVSPATGAKAVTEVPASWSDLINVQGTVRMANPDVDTPSRLAYYASRIGRPEALDLTTAGKLIFTSRFAAPSTQDLFATLTGPEAARMPFPAPEQAVAGFAASTPGALQAFVPVAGTMSLDYPWLLDTALTGDRKSLAERAFGVLRSDAGRLAVTGAGFRARPGDTGPAIEGRATPSFTELDTPDAAGRSAALEQWDVLRTDMRMLAILDVSGSMKYPAKGTKGMTRAKVTEEAAVTALRILPAGSRIGAWVFSTDQQRKGVDYRELARVERLDTAYRGRTWREHLVDVTRTIPTRLRGDTGLYDTTAAAYAKMVAEYDDGYVNSVVIMTDGKNDDPGGGLDLAGLLARIKATSKDDRPVRIITIGMGEADPRALQAISKATGGTSYIANTPSDIQRVFVQALLARTT